VGNFFSGLMSPLYIAVSWIMVKFHTAFTTLGLPAGSGVTWTLSIMGLVIVIRTLLIPLFVKQIKAQRALQMLQPEIKKLQEKYKHDREKQSQELMKLYKERKANPFSSCLPVLAQAPIFFALFGVLNGMAEGHTPKGLIDDTLAEQARNAKIFGARLFDKFLDASSPQARVVALTLVILMTASTFLQQRQLLTKNMPASALTGQYAQQQKILMYVIPLVFGVTGLGFPIGVLLYWFTTNMWSLGQQMYVIHRMPAPGSPAELDLQRRRAEKARRAGGGSAVPATPEAAPTIAESATGSVLGDATVSDGGGETPQTNPKRKQPKRQGRGKRR
jgi:YidC/Oxa1 family membrane protein insertase